MKAILVIDMPKNCGECKLYMNNGNNYWCKATGIDTTGFTMPVSCPLKPMPQKKKLEDLFSKQDFMLVHSSYVGYNQCIEEILGEYDYGDN